MCNVFDGLTQLDWTLDPLALLARWPVDRRVAMLHSGRFDARWARYTIIGEPAGVYRYLAQPTNVDTQAATNLGRSVWQGPATLLDPAAFNHHPAHDLRHLLASGAGLWLGYLGYELGEYFESKVCHPNQPAGFQTNHPQTPLDDRHWPVVDLSCCPGWLVYDAMEKRWSAHGSWSPASQTYRSDTPDWWLDLPVVSPQSGDFYASDLTSMFTRHAYESAVRKVMDYIRAGDIFQANLTQRFTTRWQGDYPLAQREAFVKLNAISPAWYGAYIETAPLVDEDDTVAANQTGRVIASTSPELFLELDERHHVTTRPIKGTRPTSVSAAELAASEKDAAELNMIVDLLRNDLGRVCDYGSVQVTQPRTIETHPTVHHGVATIQGRLHDSRDVVDLLKAAMPGGSITGAPKIRAMQIIRELEPVTRGPYCGCIGFLTHDTCSLNIAIRTMLIDQDQHRVDFSVGGGIVADSNPASEYDETITKAQAILKTLNLQVNQD